MLDKLSLVHSRSLYLSLALAVAHKESFKDIYNGTFGNLNERCTSGATSRPHTCHELMMGKEKMR